MAFNQLLWSVMNRLTGENQRDVCEIAPLNTYPNSTRVYIESFQGLITSYAYIKEYIDSSTGHCDPTLVCNESPNGLYLRAFCNGVSTFLQSTNLIFLEIEKSFLSKPNVSMIEVLNKLEFVKAVLTSFYVAIKEIKQGHYRGCKILDLCEDVMRCGTESVRHVFQSIQHECLKKFYWQTKTWILMGELNDPYDEFFIHLENIDARDDSFSSMLLGTLDTTYSIPTSSPHFRLKPDNLPCIIPLSVATKMVFIGEALTFCKHNDSSSEINFTVSSICGTDGKKIFTRLLELEKKESFSQREFSNLIDDLWVGINKHIRQVSDEVGKVKEQLLLMREIYLLGRGELFQEFLLKGSSILASDVTNTDSRTLNKLFKDAVYYVYLTENSDLVNQFYFKLPSKNDLMQGTPTLSCMSLNYKIKWPLFYLFTADVIYKYNLLFRFLLKLKKAKMDVTSWKNVISSRNNRLRMELIEVRMHLLAIVVNLQNYCFTTVIAEEVTTLLSSVDNTEMFTDLQKALSLFLTNVSNRLFLPGVPISNNSMVSLNDKYIHTVYKCFTNIFTLCHLFSELDGKEDEYISTKLGLIKSKLQKYLNTLLSLLQKMDQTDYYDSASSSTHLFNLMMCLDYNNFFRRKFNLKPHN